MDGGIDAGTAGAAPLRSRRRPDSEGNLVWRDAKDMAPPQRCGAAATGPARIRMVAAVFAKYRRGFLAEANGQNEMGFQENRLAGSRLLRRSGAGGVALFTHDDETE